MQTLIEPDPDLISTDDLPDADRAWAELARVRHAQLEAALAGRVFESARYATRARELRERAEAWA